jgi:N-acetylmuramoyl-L-alanine amidase
MLKSRSGRMSARARALFARFLAVLLPAIIFAGAVHAWERDLQTERTRLVIGLDRNVAFEVFALTAPNRVIVDLPEVGMQLPQLAEGQSVGLIKSLRSGLSAPGKSRVVVDVAAPVVIESSRLERNPGGRGQSLVIEIARAGDKGKRPIKAAYGLGAGGVEPVLQPPSPKPAVPPKVKAARIFKPIIVIDPGHGGQDSGAQKFGVSEKDVVLAFAKVLRDKLVATGRYQVMMTRDSDVFVELDDRVEFAQKHNAALFIAVHADYAGTEARGATIYSLREGVAESLKRSAKSEVADKALTGKDLVAVRQHAGADADLVRNILGDLAQREVDATRERTSVFTRSVIEYLGQSTNLKDNPDRSATFRVLKTAHFPSVLIELAYVSNKEDAQLLKSEAWRQKVSTSIVTAVENYFSHQLARMPM